MSAQQESVSLTHDLTLEGVSLTESLTDGPAGYKKITAFVKDDTAQKTKGASRQKKLEDKKRDEGLKKAYVPIELLDLAAHVGWSEVVARAQRAQRAWWKFWEIAA